MLEADTAWLPLPEDQWTRENARHLAARLGFSINPSLVDFILKHGPAGPLKNLLGTIQSMPAPEGLQEMREEMAAMRGQYQSGDSVEQREMRKEMQKQGRIAFQDYALGWYAFSREPAHSAQEKLVLFFQDVWVVAFNGVRSPSALYDYQQLIRRNLGATYPQMCKELSVTPAMVRYLNLAQNRKGSPNENFARELFELFCLGEGNYTEQDIKEAARALTGFTVDRGDQVAFRPARHDDGRKTIFGKTGNYDLPKLIDLVFEQPAAARFLPRELARFYLTDEGVSDDLIQPLADSWKQSGFSIRHLVLTFFTSRIFYDSAYRGNMIKSPVQYYLRLLQDLNLDVFPSPRRTTNVLRSMGQPFYNPPNVRGWVGGRHWINSATLSARRQLVESLLQPVPSGRLNADEVRAIEQAKAEGKSRFTLTGEQLESMQALSAVELASQFAGRFHIQADPGQLEPLFAQLQVSHKGSDWVKACLFAALTAPPYHLC